jgi:hypothetical protein
MSGLAMMKCRQGLPLARGLHSSNFRLNVSAFCGAGVALWSCLGVVMGHQGVFRVYFVS